MADFSYYSKMIPDFFRGIAQLSPESWTSGILRDFGSPQTPFMLIFLMNSIFKEIKSIGYLPTTLSIRVAYNKEHVYKFTNLTEAQKNIIGQWVCEHENPFAKLVLNHPKHFDPLRPPPIPTFDSPRRNNAHLLSGGSRVRHNFGMSPVSEGQEEERSRSRSREVAHGGLLIQSPTPVRVGWNGSGGRRTGSRNQRQRSPPALSRTDSTYNLHDGGRGRQRSRHRNPSSSPERGNAFSYTSDSEEEDNGDPAVDSDGDEIILSDDESNGFRGRRRSSAFRRRRRSRDSGSGGSRSPSPDGQRNYFHDPYPRDRQISISPPPNRNRMHPGSEQPRVTVEEVDPNESDDTSSDDEVDPLPLRRFGSSALPQGQRGRDDHFYSLGTSSARQRRPYRQAWLDAAQLAALHM